MAKMFGLSRRAWLLFLHYVMLAATLVLFYLYVSPPDATKTVGYMFGELLVLLIVADQAIHTLLGVD